MAVHQLGCVALIAVAVPPLYFRLVGCYANFYFYSIAFITTCELANGVKTKPMPLLVSYRHSYIEKEIHGIFHQSLLHNSVSTKHQGTWSLSEAAKKPKPTTTTVAPPQRKLCHRHSGKDGIFALSYSINKMLDYCESLEASSATLTRVSELWSRVSGPGGNCYNPSSWKFNPTEYRYLLRAIFRHHIDVDKDGRMSRREMSRYLEPALRYRLLPGLLDTEYRHLMDTYFRGRSGDPGRPVGEAAFVAAALRMLRTEWPIVVRRTIQDLDEDNCVTQMEFARADCRRRINEVDLYFRIADLDGNRAVTGPEFEVFKATTEPEPGEEKGAAAFNAFFVEVFRMISTYSEDYYHKTSYAHDQMVTFNEINLYLCEHII